MYSISKILTAHGIKNQSINTLSGVLIMADNGDNTFESFKIDSELKSVYNYLGY